MSLTHLYANAADVLPPELLAQVRKRWHGYLWIPGERISVQKPEAVALIRSGMDARQISVALGAQNPLKRKPLRASAEEERR